MLLTISLSVRSLSSVGFNQSIHDMRGAFVQATASYTAFAGLMGISNIGKQYEAQKAQMLVATGSKEKRI